MTKLAWTLPAALALALAHAQPATPQAYGPTVEETLMTLEAGVTRVPLNVALANIRGWQTTLVAFDDPAVQALGEQLGELATALEAETFDPAAVGGLLARLGALLSRASRTEGAHPAAGSFSRNRHNTQRPEHHRIESDPLAGRGSLGVA